MFCQDLTTTLQDVGIRKTNDRQMISHCSAHPSTKPLTLLLRLTLASFDLLRREKHRTSGSWNILELLLIPFALQELIQKILNKGH
jgi:hypothetical protein